MLYSIEHSRICVSWELLAPLFGDGLAVIVHNKIIYICGEKVQVQNFFWVQYIN